MIQDNKYRNLIWAIVILLILIITMFATIGYHVYNENKTNVQNTDSTSYTSNADAMKFSGRYFRDKLDLSFEQMEKFRDINPPFRQNAREIAMQLNEKRIFMLEEMLKNNPDTLVLNQISDEIGELHRNLKILTYKYYLDIKSFCNHEQQQKLGQIFRDLLTNDNQFGFPGKGNPPRLQRGRNK